MAATAAGVLLTAASAFASTAGVANTGAGSTNVARVVDVRESVVEQVNRSQVSNMIDLRLRTGNNSASRNTGSGAVETGSAMANVMVSNLGSSNELVEDDCGCMPADDQSLIESTGADSYNRAVVRRHRSRLRSQRNVSAFMNRIRGRLHTGRNRTNGNTGDGVVVSGPTDAMVDLLNEGNSNTMP